MLKNMLESYGLNARERMKIYTGALGGAVAPALALRYAGLDSIEATELTKWIASAAGSLVFMPLSIPFGGAMGMISALASRNNRWEKERSLEEKV